MEKKHFRKDKNIVPLPFSLVRRSRLFKESPSQTKASPLIQVAHEPRFKDSEQKDIICTCP